MRTRSRTKTAPKTRTKAALSAKATTTNGSTNGASVETKPHKRIGRPPGRNPDKNTSIIFRCSEAQKAAMQKFAAEQGIDLSAWIRNTCLRAAGARKLIKD